MRPRFDIPGRVLRAACNVSSPVGVHSSTISQRRKFSRSGRASRPLTSTRLTVPLSDVVPETTTCLSARRTFGDDRRRRQVVHRVEQLGKLDVVDFGHAASSPVSGGSSRYHAVAPKSFAFVAATFAVAAGTEVVVQIDRHALRRLRRDVRGRRPCSRPGRRLLPSWRHYVARCGSATRPCRSGCRR